MTERNVHPTPDPDHHPPPLPISTTPESKPEIRLVGFASPLLGLSADQSVHVEHVPCAWTVHGYGYGLGDERAEWGGKGKELGGRRVALCLYRVSISLTA